MSEQDQEQTSLQEMINRWWELSTQLEAEKLRLLPIREEEFKLRDLINKALYADQQENEGTNYHPLGNGWRLKTVIKIKRTVDEAALGAVKIELQKMLVNPDQFFRTRTELEVKVYKEQTEEIKLVLAGCVSAKAEAPTMEAVPPKEKDQKGST